MIYCKYSNQDFYPFVLPNLPFKKDSLAPYFSEETFDYHHGKHHNAYVTNLNNLLKTQKTLLTKNLEQIIFESHTTNTAIFNNAAQIWNHTFFWHSIKPHKEKKPSGSLLKQIEKDFSSYTQFVEVFQTIAVSKFGSGWTWLVFDGEKLTLMNTANAENPIIHKLWPIITCDVWEHAYYIDYRNKKPDYITIFINNMINWDFAMSNFEKAKKLINSKNS